MLCFELKINQDPIIYPIENTNSTAYLKYYYQILYSPYSTAVGNIFISNNGIGVGTLYLSFNNQQQGLYISCLCSFLDSKLVYKSGAVIGGHGKYQNITGGSVTFGFNQSNRLYLYIQERINAIFDGTTLTQNIILTNKSTHTTEIQRGNPRTIFRVGSFTVTDINQSLPIGTFYFTSYDESNLTGFGNHMFLNDQQILFAYYLSAYTTSIFDPLTDVKSVRGSLVGGQKYAKYIKTGIFECHTFPPSLNEKYSYFYKEQDQSTFTTFQVVARNRNAIVIATADVYGSIRIGYYELYDENNEFIGFLYFSSFITDKQIGLGQGVFAFENKNNLYLTYQNDPQNPLDPNSLVLHSGCITGGNGKYKNVSWGTTDWKTITNTSYEINIKLYT
jgi:hypothetical protein